MLISYRWLSTYFKDPLPAPRDLADVITMHAYAVDRVYEQGGDTILDIDVLPNRAPDSLSHRGVAKEVAALLQKELVLPARFLPEKLSEHEGINIKIENLYECGRYVGRVIHGVKIGPSPDWLVERLTAVGQKSINNIVDITNYILLDMGQPMHAFDLDKISGKEISVRKAKDGEHISTLDGKDVVLTSTMLVIADTEGPLAIAGVKGGKKAEITSETKSIVLEAAHFNSVSVRKTARSTGILTDSSKRFENGITPELAGYAMDEASALIYEIFPEAQVSPTIDQYLWKPNPYTTGLSTAEANAILGTKLDDDQVKEALERVGCTVYFERNPISRVFTVAKQGVGATYKNGASIQYQAPHLFDCSSFTAYVFAQAGVSIPRMTVDQYMYGADIGEHDLSLGDLVFANTKSGQIHHEGKEFFPGKAVPEGVDHCGIYLGDGKIVHATRHGKGKVVIEELAGSEAFENIIGYRRIPEVHAPRFVVVVPAERLDLRDVVSLSEEVGRIVGYDTLPDSILSKLSQSPQINKSFYYTQAIRQTLKEEGYSEVITYAFTDKGEIETANPIASDKGFLRPNLTSGITKSLEMNARNADLIGEKCIRIFEIGTVFTKTSEHLSFGIGAWHPKGYKDKAIDEITRVLGVLEKKHGCVFGGSSQGDKEKAIYESNFKEIILSSPEPSDYGSLFEAQEKVIEYKKISPYPFVTRDIAFWASGGTKEEEVMATLVSSAGPLLIREPRLFDVFEKKDEGKVSYAYRLVFQSYEKTLTDDEVNKHMENVVRAVEEKGWTVR